MRTILLTFTFLLPGIIFSQRVNKFQYNNEGKLHSSFTGSDNSNYSFIHYHNNGLKASTGKFKNGVKHGVWKTWNSIGELEAIAHYKHGEKTGKWIIKDKIDKTIFEISFNHNHMLHALRKNNQGQIVATR